MLLTIKIKHKVPDLTSVTQNTVDSCLLCNRPLHTNFVSVNNISDELKLWKPNIFGWNKHGWFLLVINHFVLNLEVQKNKSFTEILETGNICAKLILLILTCFVTNQYIVHLEVQTILMMLKILETKNYSGKKIVLVLHKKIIWGLKHWNSHVKNSTSQMIWPCISSSLSNLSQLAKIPPKKLS